MLSRDASGLDAWSAAATRWRLLRDAGVDISVIVATSRVGSWEEEGLKVVATGGNIVTKWLKLSRRTDAQLRALNFDLVTAQDPFELGLIAVRSAKRFGVPCELQDHGGFFDGGEVQEPLWFLRSRLAWRLACRTQSIRTVSPGSLEGLKKVGLGDKAYWLPIAAEARFAEALRRPEADLIVTTGRLVAVKRHDLLIRSFAEYRKKHPAARLAIVGDGPLKSGFVGLANSLGLGENVLFIGQGDPLPWLEKAVCFVMLSRHEGWGVAAVEAAMVGAPVLMADTGCAGYLVSKEKAILATSWESEKIAGLIEKAQEISGASAPLDLPDQSQAALLQIEAWKKVVAKPTYRVLVVCQAVDEDDALFGFFVQWLKHAAKSFDRVSVLALRVGRHSLPPEVAVNPLRQMSGRSKLAVVWNLWRWSWKLRATYDGVYIRGDVQYPVLAGWLWKLLGKKAILFYAHYTSKTKWLKPAAWFSDAVVTSVGAACALPQAIKIGQGVDAERFKDVRRHEGAARALVFGRVSPVKRVPWMLERIAKASPEAARHVDIVGRSLAAEEGERLRQAASKFGAAWEERDVPNDQAPGLYLAHDIYLNATPGSLDKTIVEACLSGLVVVASTPAYGEMLPNDLKWLNPADGEFGAAAVRALALDSDERREIGKKLHDLAAEKHSQRQQIERLEKLFSGR